MIFVTSAQLISANGLYLLRLVADTASDLPNGDTVQVGNAVYEIAPGSTAIAADTGGEYLRSPSGSWILQPSQQSQIILPDVYSEAEVDSLLNPIRTNVSGLQLNVSNLQTQQTKNTNALINLMGVSGKNHLRVTASDRTHNGITFTVNSDGTVTANGTATANAYIQVASIPADSSLFDGSYRLCGCPEGGSRQSYAQYAALSSYARYDYGESVSLIPTEGLTGGVGIIIMIYAGYTADNVIFKPMVCKAVDYLVSPEFAPYCPTLPELYELVKSYHP